MHLLRPARGLRAVVQRGCVSPRVFFLQVGEERVDRSSDGELEHADYRRHVLRLVGQSLEHVGDIGREVVRRSKRPKGVARMLVNRADGRSDGDDVLLHRSALAPANVVERVVSDGAVHGVEVDAVDDVAVFLEVRAHLVIEGAFAIEHNVGPLALQQVRLDVVARFPAARRPEHENVVVQPASPRVAADGSVGGKQGFSLVGNTLRVASRLAFGLCSGESLRKLVARGAFGDGFEFSGLHKLLLRLRVDGGWGNERAGDG